MFVAAPRADRKGLMLAAGNLDRILPSYDELLIAPLSVNGTGLSIGSILISLHRGKDDEKGLPACSIVPAIAIRPALLPAHLQSAEEVLASIYHVNLFYPWIN